MSTTSRVALNPYAPQLGDRDALEVIAATAAHLERIAGSLGPAHLNRSPAPGKWSAREILCHLADCELVFAFRLRQTLAETHHTIQPFDQERWATSYAAYDADLALAVFASVRRWNITLIRSMSPDTWVKPVTHPERGVMTFRVVVETMAGHDLNHLRQLEALAGRQRAFS